MKNRRGDGADPHYPPVLRAQRPLADLAAGHHRQFVDERDPWPSMSSLDTHRNDVHRLAVFVQVAKAGSFAAAAKNLGLTPPAVSKSIAKLERQLDCRLFNRTTRHLHLTAEGRSFLAKVEEGLSILDEAIHEVSESRREPTGLLRVFMSASFGTHCVLPLLPVFFARYPKLKLDIALSEDVPNLVRDGFDIGIHYKDTNEENSSLVSRRLCALPLALVASPSYLAGKEEPCAPGDLLQHEWIKIRLGPGDTPEWEFCPPSTRDAAGGGNMQPESFRLQVPSGRLKISGGLEGVFTAVLSGLGLMVVPMLYAQPWLQTGELRQLLPGWRIKVHATQEAEVFIIYPYRKRLTAKARALVDFLFEQFDPGYAELPPDRRSID